MATKYGVNATKRLNSVPVQKVDSRQQVGGLRVAYDEYELTADLASADVIILGHLPKGAKIVNAILAFDDLDATGGTVDVGLKSVDPLSAFVAVPEAIFKDVDVTSAGIVDIAEAAIVGEINGASGFGYEASEDLEIYLSIDGDTDATSGTIKCGVFYTLD